MCSFSLLQDQYVVNCEGSEDRIRKAGTDLENYEWIGKKGRRSTFLFVRSVSFLSRAFKCFACCLCQSTVVRKVWKFQVNEWTLCARRRRGLYLPSKYDAVDVITPMMEMLGICSSNR